MSQNKNGLGQKRKYPRRLFNAPVGVLFMGQYQLTKSTSLGEGGLAFLWKAEMSLAHGAVVTFKIPGSSMISIHSDVRSSKRWEDDNSYFIVGVQFQPLPIAEKRKIRGFVSSRTETEPIF